MAPMHRRNRIPAVLVTAALLALLLTAAGGGLIWAAQSGVLRGPTPTPSATPFAPPTPTPDFRATRTAEDIVTQVAYTAQLATRTAQTGGTPVVPLPGILVTAPALPPVSLSPVSVPLVVQTDATATALALLDAEAAATAAAGALATAQAAQSGSVLPSPVATTTAAINLPVVQSGEQPPPPAPTPLPPPPPVVEAPPTDTPIPPTATPIPPTATPTFTPLPPPPTFTPSPTIPFVVNSLIAVIDRQAGLVRVGPSSLYTQTGSIALGTQVTLLARDNTGEWLYVCCAANTNQPGWMRGVSARPTLNPTPAPVGTASGDDVRWLTVRFPDAVLTPIPTTEALAVNDFPMARRDRGNTGRVAALPQLPLQTGWPMGGQAGLAGQTYTSGAIVVGSSVIAASADGHIYCFDRDSGSQRWRFYLGETVRATPLADGGLIFVVTESGRLVALEDQGLQAVQRWAQNMALQPRGMVAAAGRILLTGRASDAERLLIIDRGNGGTLRSVSLGGAPSQLPAVGGQTVYVTSDLVRAIDIFAGDVVWQSAETTTFTTPPLFSSPGVKALAELYTVDAAGRLFAFDANTGSILWVAPVGAAATGLAANNTSVFATGPGFVRAFTRTLRTDTQLLWSAGVAGNVPGGALVDDARVLVGTDSGAFQYLDVVTGALLQGNVQAPALGGAIAAAGPWLFAPTQSGALFAARQQ